FVDRFYGAGSWGAAQRFRKCRSDCHGGEWRWFNSTARAQIPAQPAAADDATVSLAVLHLVLRFKMRTSWIIGAHCLDNAQSSFIESRKKRTQLRMKGV